MERKKKVEEKEAPKPRSKYVKEKEPVLAGNDLVLSKPEDSKVEDLPKTEISLDYNSVGVFPQEQVTTSIKPVDVEFNLHENGVVTLDPVEKPVDTRITWRKIGGGSLRFRGQIIKPNQTFLAHLHEIPKDFLSFLVCVEPDKLKVQEKKFVATETDIKFTLKLTEFGLYNVVNANGKAINAMPMEKEKAEQLKIALES